MLAAERQRKVRSLGAEDALARDEDLVTSTVFGLLSYLPRGRGLGALFQTLVGDHPPTEAVSLTFWPEDSGTEPDVVLETQHAIVLIEAKLDAPFGSNQLGREWLWLLRRVKQREAAAAAQAEESPRLMIVTITRRPLGDVELRRRISADLLELRSVLPGPTENEVRATTWHEIADLILQSRSTELEAHADTILDDLDYFLRSRGLREPPFDAWPMPPRRWPDCPLWYVGAESV